MVNKNTAKIIAVQEHVKGLGIQCKATDDTVKKLNDRTRVGRTRDENSSRPIIIHHAHLPMQSMESFPQLRRDKEEGFTDGRRPHLHGETMQKQTLANGQTNPQRREKDIMDRLGGHYRR
ncbi:unnamed protein product, partial [Scomber scombrus]